MPRVKIFLDISLIQLLYVDSVTFFEVNPKWNITFTRKLVSVFKGHPDFAIIWFY